VHTDRYGLPLSTASDVARDAYVAGADCLLAGTAEVEGLLQSALAADPRFALARVAFARQRFLVADVAQAREHAAKARELAGSATPRERSHVDAIALAIEGRPADALAATRAHLADYPRDAMVLAPATGVFGLIGFSGRREREEELYELLRGLSPHLGGDWWFDSMLAFAACETGRLDEAATLIDAAMVANPRNAYGAHILVHVLHEQGEMAGALDFLERWMPGYGRLGLLHCHLSWHAAMCALALGRRERAWEAYRAGVHPGAAWGPPINIATDAPAFLWRSELAGHARSDELWRDVHRYVLGAFPKAGLPFADVHVALACVASADWDGLEQRLGDLRERIGAGRYAAGEVVPTLVEAFAAYAKRDWEAAIRLFERALPETVRIGGSRAQRDLAEFTLFAAEVAAGRPEEARRRIVRRGDRRATVNVAGCGHA
jgi:tetratricopeptide (TPR) repeat protein